MNTPLAVIALPGAQALAERLAQETGARLLGLESRRFPDGECYLRVLDEVAGCSVIVAGQLSPPDAGALALMFLADTLRELGARRVGLVLPYLPYMRQDARFHPGEAVTSVSFARWLSGSVDWLATVDPHLHRHKTLGEIYRIPAQVVPSAPAVAQWVKVHVPRPVIVGPDEESLQWVEDVAARVGCPHAVLRKRRLGDHEVQIELPPLDRLAGRTPVLLDDIISSGRTLAVALRELRGAGHLPGVCIGVHGLFADDARALLQDAGAAQVVTCNTLPADGPQIDLLGDVARVAFDLAGGRDK